MNSPKLINLTSNSIFLDTNIFIYAVGKNHPLKLACQKILVSLEENPDFQAVISVEVWQELLHYFQKRANFVETIDLFLICQSRFFQLMKKSCANPSSY